MKHKLVKVSNFSCFSHKEKTLKQSYISEAKNLQNFFLIVLVNYNNPGFDRDSNEMAREKKNNKLKLFIKSFMVRIAK